MKIPVKIEYCPGFSERAIGVTNLLGSDLRADYQAVQDWLKKSKLTGLEMFLAGMYRKEGGVLLTDNVKEE